MWGLFLRTADNNTALDQLFGVIDRTETPRPDFHCGRGFQHRQYEESSAVILSTHQLPDTWRIYWTRFISLCDMDIKLSLALPSANQTAAAACLQAETETGQISDTEYTALEWGVRLSSAGLLRIYGVECVWGHKYQHTHCKKLKSMLIWRNLN